MAVNTTEISTVYDTLLAAMIAKYDIMWTANEIDAETYAQLVGQASSQLVQLSAELVQKQESLDKDLLIKDQELINLQKQGVLLDSQKQTVYSQRVLADKQAAKLGLDNAMKLSEAERVSNANYIYTPRYEEV